MDAYVEEVPEVNISTSLSYDEGITYEEQVAALPPELPRNESSALAGRISMNKVYLPPESMSKGKRKRGDEEYEDMEEDESVDAVPDGLRPNALYLRGSPITHLPTNNIFVYARHFDLDPVGLEWIDDSSCVLIFPTNAACRTALEALRRTPSEEPDFDDCVSAKPVPVIIWPVEDRVNKTLGKSEEMEGILLIRIARNSDKKSRGAKYRSGFYQKHGMDAGKDPNAHSIGRASENGDASKRKAGPEGSEEERRQLDEELDDFLRREDLTAPSPPFPPSKMRSDWMTKDGRSVFAVATAKLLERTSLTRVPSDDEESAEPTRSRQRKGVKGRRQEPLIERISELPPARRRKHENGETRLGRYEPAKKTREELDDELEAFLHGRN
ncbi:hypothetical protein ACEPAF_6700 [Sanghuangporus sanghuang]